jgi:hypothetical protein
MADLNKELAKSNLERQGYLVTLDVPYEEGGFEASGFDLIGARICDGQVVEAAVGVVRGWWHAGSYLTPGLIRSHLQTSRNLLSEAFAAKRDAFVREKFGLGQAPIRHILFFSQKSPRKSEEAERILNSMGIEVVYLEEIVIETLPLVGKQPLGDGDVFQVISMVRYSRLFRQMRAAMVEAGRLRKLVSKLPPREKKDRPEKPAVADPQLDFLTARLEETEDDENGSEE